MVLTSAESDAAGSDFTVYDNFTLVQLNSEYDVLVALPYALRGQTVCGMDNYGEAVCNF